MKHIHTTVAAAIFFCLTMIAGIYAEAQSKYYPAPANDGTRNTTRMRVEAKNEETSFQLSHGTSQYGQVEDYMVSITDPCSNPNTADLPSGTLTYCLFDPNVYITHTTTGATGISDDGVGGANSLPQGVYASFASNKITISGTLLGTGIFNYSIPLTGGCGTVYAIGTITGNDENYVYPASSTPTVCINIPLTSITHSTTNGTGISNNNVAGANGLPPGVSASFASNTITISGTPTALGTYDYSILLTGGCGTFYAKGKIVVTDIPSASIIGAASFCLGSSTILYFNNNNNSVGDIAATSAGDSHSLFLKNDGTAWATGRNQYGQLGVGSTASTSTPINVNGLSGITAIAAGKFHSLFLKNDGTVWATGLNNFGQLGDGTILQRTTPVQVSGLNGITAIAAGGSHSLFLKNDGTVWATGANDYGQLGDGTNIDQTSPVQVSGLSSCTAISAGQNHSLFLKNDGTVWATGYNDYGQLGDGTNVDQASPVQVSGLNNCTSITAGRSHSLFLKNDGTAWATGRNGEGALGNGTTTDATTPGQVSGLSGITAIAAGQNHSLFLKSDGTVWATGRNGSGQLGEGTTTDATTPVQVSGLSGITAIAGGGSHSLFLKNTGTAWATGYNGRGQFGDGTTTSTVTPVFVSGFSFAVTSYQWYKDGNSITGATDASYTVTASGSYTVEGSSGAGCSSTSAATIVLGKAPTYSTTDVIICPSELPYSWNGLTFTTAGSQTATLTNAVGCDSSATLNLFVNTNVGITDVSAANNPICGGTKTTLTANGVIGTNALVTWYDGPPSVVVNGGVIGTGLTSPLVGVGTYYAQVTGICGTPAQASITLTGDVTNPLINCPNNATFDNSNSAACSVAVVLTAPTFSDNCKVKSVSWVMTGATVAASSLTGIRPITGRTLNNGTTNITYTVSDFSNLTNSCSFTVTINDVVKPSFTTALANINVTTTGCSASINVPNVSITDNCGIPALKWVATGATIGNGNSQVGTMNFNLGTTTLTYTLTDANANTRTASILIKVTETTPPIITCPLNIATSTIGTNCTKNIATIPPNYATPCGVKSLTWNMTGATVLSSPINGIWLANTKPFKAGLTTVKYTATYLSGSTATCSYTVQLNTTNTCPIANQARNIVVANEETTTHLKTVLSPNPTSSTFALRVKSNSNTAVEVTVYNSEGKRIQQLKTANLNNIVVGEKYVPGSYLFEVKQGEKKTTVVGVKQ